MPSGLFYPTFRDALTGVIALDLGLETHKVALFTSTVTPDFDTNTAYGVAPWNANEVSGTGWNAGGVVLTTTAVSSPGAALFTFDAGDVNESGTTLADSDYALIYADALAGDNAICAIEFPAGDYSTNNGSFQIQWDAAGIFTIDLTP